MKKILHVRWLLCFLIAFTFISCGAQNGQNWTPDQLMNPAVLAKKINDKSKLPVILSIGPGAVIPSSIDIGMVENAENLNRFKKTLSSLSKNTDIVIYCGCCPYEHCPNIRPAISILKEMKFTNFHLLDLPNNIRTNWISKGYPIQ